MKLIWRITVMLMIAGLIAGCAMPGSIVPNATTADELVKKLGKPSDTRKNAQGGESWDYAYGPEGTETWRFDIDSGRMVRNAAQILTQERLYQVVPGVTTEAQVLELLGRPRMVTKFTGSTAWEWRVLRSPARGIFVVSFNHSGLATGVSIMEDMTTDGGDRGGDK